MWRYVGDGRHIGAGVPAEDMTDEQFDAVEAEYDKQFPGQEGALRTCGLWVQEGPKAKPVRAEEEEEDG